MTLHTRCCISWLNLETLIRTTENTEHTENTWLIEIRAFTVGCMTRHA